MASQFHQLRVLVWKNWLGVKRQPVSNNKRGELWDMLPVILKCDDVNEVKREEF